MFGLRLFLVIYLLVGVFSFGRLPLSKRQNQQNATKCSCGEVQCACCAIFKAPATTDVCATLIWNKEVKNICGDIDIGGFLVVNSCYDVKHPTQCSSIFSGKLCVNLRNATITDSGACGYFDFEANYYTVDVTVELGTFKFGTISDLLCPNRNITEY